MEIAWRRKDMSCLAHCIKHINGAIIEISGIKEQLTGDRNWDALNQDSMKYMATVEFT